MQRLPLRRQRPQHALGLVLRDRRRRENQLDLVAAPQLVVAAPSRQRRHGLEPPLLEGDAAEGLVAVVDDFALPAALHLFPLGPFAGGEVGAAVDVAGGGSGGSAGGGGGGGGDGRGRS